MNPDNGCKDRNSSKGEKEVPMNTIFSYMNLQDNKVLPSEYSIQTWNHLITSPLCQAI